MTAPAEHSLAMRRFISCQQRKSNMLCTFGSHLANDILCGDLWNVFSKIILKVYGHQTYYTFGVWIRIQIARSSIPQHSKDGDEVRVCVRLERTQDDSPHL
jgi:hypothetical protein